MGNVRVMSSRRLIRLGVTAVMSVMLAAGMSSAAAAKTAAGDSAGGVGAASIQTTATYWNDVLLEIFRRKGGLPGPLTRLAAMMHAVVFDTLNSARYSQTGSTPYDSYLTKARVSSSVDADLAAGFAARDILWWAEPGFASFIGQKFTERHGSANQAAARNLASKVVGDMQTARTNDGSVDDNYYAFDGVPGAWAYPMFGYPPEGHHWGNVRPFAMASGSQFRQPALAPDYQTLLAGSEYRNQVAEVRALGADNSTVRTQNQTDIALFWANDADGTYKAPGQLLNHTRIVATANTTDGMRLSRSFALTSLALADAAIAAWDMKFQTSIDLWRPQEAIWNDPVSPDPTWRPLGVTPYSPSWVSGHATLAAAWAGVMRSEFGDNVTFTTTTEDPNASVQTRTFTSLTAAAAEHARSRVYLGVNFSWSGEDGAAAGYGVADLVFNNFLRAQP